MGALLVWWLNTSPLPEWMVELISLYLVFAFYTLIGAIVRPHHLHDEVGIYKPVERSEAEMNSCLQNLRTDVLNHAYGFISRGNRVGGLKHIRDWIEEDPDPVLGWQWFFDQMMRWEIKDPALVFGQQYLGWLLRNGDHVAAVKVMLRCRMENEAFQPLAEDKPLALEAAERAGPVLARLVAEAALQHQQLLGAVVPVARAVSTRNSSTCCDSYCRNVPWPARAHRRL